MQILLREVFFVVTMTKQEYREYVKAFSPASPLAKDALRAFRGKERKISMVKSMFRILANSGRKRAGQPEDVTGEEINGCNLADLDEIAKAMNATMEEAMHAETVGGNEADDEVHDEYMEDLEQNEKNA